ncbi:MAG: hypothetical protein KKD38_03960 [Candidatus Delongbacteria bacterium]|nr:hypothetical protein [Candidatus Delongbacteria bacterium]MCG2760805.1 hypothetical protein [Candidatus Delongbacteria bacterium]
MKKAIIVILLLSLQFLFSSISIASTARVTVGNANLGVYGNIKNSSANLSTVVTSRLVFTGSANDTITNIYSFPNITVNKTSGSLRLNNSTNNFLLTSNITFTKGNVLTGTNTFEVGTSATLSGESINGYVSGNLKAARVVGTGTNTFGGIGYSINNTGADLGTVTVYRYSGSGNQVTIYGSQGILRKWTVQTSNAFSGTRSVTSSWLSNEDNSNNLTALKVWKYEPVKSSDGDTEINNLRKVILKKDDISSVKSKGIEGSENTISGEPVEMVYEPDAEGQDSKNLYWVEVKGATFNTAASPRTATYTVNAATSFTVCSVINAFADGAGTVSNPYQVATLTQLDNVRNYPTACFIQIANIDASATTGWNDGLGWAPINNFTGKYNGDGHTISNLYISRTGTLYIGLFGYTTAGSEIKDMGLDNVDFTGGNYTGGFVGYSRGTVKKCYSKGQVKSSTGSRVGGFSGYATTGSSIYDCYSNTEVTRLSGGASTYIGGFLGQLSSGPIERCYSTGGVHYEDTSDPTNRGFLGLYSAGTMSNNFWNTETSGQETTGGTATGLTNTEMRTLSTFTDATWDFVGESVNGTDDIWNIHTSLNNGYPYLNWEYRIPVEAPANLAMSVSGTDITLYWDAVSGATGYAVYSSVDPYGTFVLDETGSFNGTEWTVSTPETKKFYFVTATNETKLTAAKIKLVNRQDNR